MKTGKTVYRNKHYIKRNYECTNVVACLADKKPDENWVEADESLLDKLDQLYTENDVRYFGYL